MVKIFVGNIGDSVSGDELRGLFAQYGNVTECDVLGSYGFVHMEQDSEAEVAIKNLDKYHLNGTALNVEKSKGGPRGGSRGGRGGGGGGPARGGMGGAYGRPFGGGFATMGDNSAAAKSARRAGCTKLHVANLPESCHSNELRQMFERYGYVAECDVVEDRKIAFVHIEECAADAAIHGLNGYTFKGMPLKVQMSKNQGNPPVAEAPMYPGVSRGRGGFMPQRGGRGGMFPRGGGRPGDFPRNGRGAYDELGMDPNHGYGEKGYETNLPPPAKDRMELLELLDRRRRLEALDPYERRLIACTDPFNLPPPPPEYLRLLRERAVVKARLPLPPTSSVLNRSLPTAGATTASSALARALVARRAAAAAAAKSEHMRNAGGALDSYGEPKPMPSLAYPDMYPPSHGAGY